MEIISDKFETDLTTAKMDEDKLKVVELSMAAMNISHENIEAKMREMRPHDQDKSCDQDDRRPCDRDGSPGQQDKSRDHDDRRPCN